MDAYYQQQTQQPYFGGQIRQRGSGIGALVLGARVAVPFVRRLLIPAAKRALPIVKRIGRDLISAALPEVVDVIRKKKTPKQALKSTVSTTVRKQLGGGKNQNRKRSQTISSRDTGKRSRSQFFSSIKNAY